MHVRMCMLCMYVYNCFLAQLLRRRFGNSPRASGRPGPAPPGGAQLGRAGQREARGRGGVVGVNSYSPASKAGIAEVGGGVDRGGAATSAPSGAGAAAAA